MGIQDRVGKIKKIIDAGAKGLSLASNLLCSVAIGEKLPTHIRESREVRQVLYGLRRYRFIMHDKYHNSFKLTEKGKKKIEEIVIDDIAIKDPQKWDGKWRLVMYDLPIRFKKARNAFRWKIKDMGFYQFQKSAWIYPYPCEKEIGFVADFFGVWKHVEILEVDKISNDKEIRKHFGI